MVVIPHATYFEGVLQLRNPTQKLIHFVVDTVEADQKAAITKITKVKSGFDYYLTSQKYLQILGRKIKKKFSGEFKLSPTLHTQRKSGERLYRITILFRLYAFKRGDIVHVQGDEYEIINIKTKIMCKEVKSGKKKWFDPGQIKIID